jgi:hypothetical protein
LTRKAKCKSALVRDLCLLYYCFLLIPPDDWVVEWDGVKGHKGNQKSGLREGKNGAPKGGERPQTGKKVIMTNLAHDPFCGSEAAGLETGSTSETLRSYILAPKVSLPWPTDFISDSGQETPINHLDQRSPGWHSQTKSVPLFTDHKSTGSTIYTDWSMRARLLPGAPGIPGNSLGGTWGRILR